MTLAELSPMYREGAAVISLRLHDLRLILKAESDPDRQLQLRQRILLLQPMLRQMRELAELTEHYYERGRTRNGHYTL